MPSPAVTVSPETVTTMLRGVIDPELGSDVVELGGLLERQRGRSHDLDLSGGAIRHGDVEQARDEDLVAGHALVQPGLPVHARVW